MYKSYYITVNGSHKLIPGASNADCKEDMTIYFQIVPADCHGRRVKTLRVYEIVANARTTLRQEWSFYKILFGMHLLL